MLLVIRAYENAKERTEKQLALHEKEATRLNGRMAALENENYCLSKGSSQANS